MPDEKDLMVPLIIRYKGFYDYQGFYKLLRKWCEDQHFRLHEHVFKEKPATMHGMETEFKWEARRKETPLIKYYINFKVIVTDNVPVEVVQNGVKKKMYKGRIQFLVKPYLKYDWQNRFKSKPAKFFLWFLWTKVFKDEWIKKHANYLNEIVYMLGEDVKKFLNMYTHGHIYY